MGERLRKSEGYKPVGGLSAVLERFDAPEDARALISRRVGTLSGTPALPVSRIEGIIEHSMEENAGLPNWGDIEQSLGTIVTKAYKKFRRP